MNCPNCGTYNDPDNRFCLKCGAPCAGTATAAPPTTRISPSSTAPPSGWTPPAHPQYNPPQTYPPQPGYAAAPYYGAPGLATLNIWGPFAGYGTRRRHVGWLMNGEGQHASELVTKVEAKFREREIPGTYLSREALVGRGVMVETRPYFILRRGLASLALYITQFGRDLFISLASYLKPPISNFRVTIVVVMLIFQAYMTFLYPVAIRSEFLTLTSSISLFGTREAAPNADPLLFLFCVIGPLGGLNFLALFLLFCFSAYKWLTEKDFWAALRVPPNEFNEDDLMATEKAVEETVRQSLTELKLNPDDLKLATIGQGGQLF